MLRRSAPPLSSTSCSRIVSHDVSRACLEAMSEERAWNTSAFTFSRGTSRTCGDLLVGDVAGLGEHERGALVLGQLVQVAQEVAQVLAALDDGGQVLGRRLVRLLERALAPGAEHGEAAVAGDRVEPGAQLDALVGADELAVGGHEGVLDGVLGLLGACRACGGRRRGCRGGGGRRRPRTPARSRRGRARRADRRRRGGAAWRGPGGRGVWAAGGRGFHRARIIDRSVEGRSDSRPSGLKRSGGCRLDGLVVADRARRAAALHTVARMAAAESSGACATRTPHGAEAALRLVATFPIP